MHALDNPVWSALTTTHSHLALGDGLARRYPRQVTTIAACSEPTPEAFAQLSRFVDERETVALLFDKVPSMPKGWELVRNVDLVQMVYVSGKATRAESGARPEMVLLRAKDSAEMVELGQLTNPGPIGSRSHEIGDFVGVRNDDGRLIAMAGERFRFPKHAEISGVCTRPGFEGRGLAAALVVHVLERILSRVDKAFLHSRAENVRAIKLYERLGFETRRHFELGILRRL